MGSIGVLGLVSHLAAFCEVFPLEKRVAILEAANGAAAH